MSFIYSEQGLGGAASPLIATLFVSAGIKFSYFFAVSLGFAAINVSILLCTFRLKREVATENEHELVERSNTAGDAAMGEEGEPNNGSASSRNKAGAAGMREVLQNKTVLTISFFLMLYCVSFGCQHSVTLPETDYFLGPQGAEVAIGVSDLFGTWYSMTQLVLSVV